MGTVFNTKKIAASYHIVEKRKKYTNFAFLDRSYQTRTQNSIAEGAQKAFENRSLPFQCRVSKKISFRKRRSHRYCVWHVFKMVTACIDEKNYVSACGAISAGRTPHPCKPQRNAIVLYSAFWREIKCTTRDFRPEIAVMAKRRFRKRSLQNKENKKAKRFYRYGKKIHHSSYTIYWLNEEIQLSSP